MMLALASLAAAAAQDPPVATFRADSRLVLLEFSVARQREAILNLAREDVRIFEDGKQQRIAVFEPPGAGPPAVPVEAAFLLDVSGTVVLAGLFDARTIQKAFLAGLRQRAGISVYSFAREYRRHCPPTRDPAVLEAALSEAKRQKHDGTSLYRSIVQVAEELGAMREPARRMLFVISDGIPEGDRTTPEQAADAARRSGIRVFPVVLTQSGPTFPGSPVRDNQDRVDMPLMRFASLGSETGGRSFRLDSLPGSNLFARALESVVEQVNLEYTAGYYAADSPGKPRRYSVDIRLRDRSLGSVYGGKRVIVR